jgi:hypothetical protein
MTINFNLDNLDDKAPLYSRYPQQYNTQPAYVEIDPNTRTVSADYSGEIGNAVPMSVWHGRIIRISVPAEIHGPSLAEYLQLPETIAELEQICDGYDEKWDGNNWKGTLTEAAQLVVEHLERDIPENVLMVEVWGVAEWLFSSCALREHWDTQPIEEAVEALERLIDDNVELDGDIADALIEEAKNQIDAENWNRLTTTHIAELARRGLINENDVQTFTRAKEA